MRSKTMPKGEARPLGSPAPKRVRKIVAKKPLSKDAALSLDHSFIDRILEQKNSQENLDTSTATVLDFPTDIALHAITRAATQKAGDKIMMFTLKGFSKNGKTALYNGGAIVQRHSLSAFIDKKAPESFEVADGIFAAKAGKVAKAKLTKEERAALPKPTLAEKAAKARERAEKLEAAARAAEAEQPSL